MASSFVWFFINFLYLFGKNYDIFVKFNVKCVKLAHIYWVFKYFFDWFTKFFLLVLFFGGKLLQECTLSQYIFAIQRREGYLCALTQRNVEYPFLAHLSKFLKETLSFRCFSPIWASNSKFLKVFFLIFQLFLIFLSKIKENLSNHPHPHKQRIPKYPFPYKYNARTYNVTTFHTLTYTHTHTQRNTIKEEQGEISNDVTFILNWFNLVYIFLPCCCMHEPIRTRRHYMRNKKETTT